MKIEMDDYLEFWTADEVCECLSFQKHMPEGINRESTDRKLWSFVAEANNPTPLGGDGSDGTVETPCGRLNPDNDDKAPHWWGNLEDYEKIAINKAIKEYYSI